MSTSTSVSTPFFSFLAAILLGTGSAVAAASSQPVITGIEPNQIRAEGGVPVTITGHGLGSATSATIGGSEVMLLEVINDETIEVVTGASMNAYATEVTVQTPNGTATVNGMLNMDPVQQGAVTPEPSRALLLAAGLGALITRRRRRLAAGS
ncbi:MAG: IPT/TIG domain-containing protein [Prosthecobacter sp.]|uniref:IPT/TIG domain-containing protein n=1 Tax=Prosthecobacter sp. TaxID=1965333 RepID=UPI00260B71FD|nr:IPT/TIG domain-containing protein [Prosthecobacter sp.]MCF7789559.1 IPT/TIG domain-containing protein [Prosthecobacter sp.]